MSKAELLAPAGDMSCIEAALYFGADAVYFAGPDLQLRSDKVGFSFEDLEKAIALIHRAGKKAYITVNAFADNEEAERAGDYARQLYSMGADAVIVADLGVLVSVKRAAPELEVHISTQANCTNYMTARTYHDLGASRIVLARELSIDDIAQIRAKTPAGLELECFVHGAMCMSYSGRCMISAFLTGRSANRGACTQPCRWTYSVVEQTRPGEVFTVTEGGGETAFFSSHDLCCVEFLPDLEKAGVCSFKIEGRMKSNFYVASVVDAYRRAMDGTADTASCRADLENVSHRPYSCGFYFGRGKFDHKNDGQYHSGAVFIAEVLDWKDGTALVRQRNRFALGDTLEILSPNSHGLSFAVTSLSDEDGMPVPDAPHPMQILRVSCPHPVSPGDLLRRRQN